LPQEKAESWTPAAPPPPPPAEAARRRTRPAWPPSPTTSRPVTRTRSAPLPLPLPPTSPPLSISSSNGVTCPSRRIRLYTWLSHRCFSDCVTTFYRKTLGKREGDCVRACVRKYQ
uniref:Mitochondrial import inner membrane translocase subunit n=1 Tax=Aegilops tauschii subsp. strangulata TaxID=200361 RepID=A0A452XMZ1_AEGTS